MVACDPPWVADARAVAGLCATSLDVGGVYVHGSAALGGFTGASDLDLLVVADGECDWEDLGRDLLALRSSHPIEMSIVSSRAARDPASPWPFLLHVAQPKRVAFDEGSGDPDLIAHYAVARQSGIAIVGPPAARLIGAVARVDLLAYLEGELTWGLDHADQRYAVLNACRAVAYATDGVLLSKVAGARWWRDHRGCEPMVEAALHAQRTGADLGPSTREAGAFVRASRAMVSAVITGGAQPPA